MNAAVISKALDTILRLKHVSTLLMIIAGKVFPDSLIVNLRRHLIYLQRFYLENQNYDEPDLCDFESEICVTELGSDKSPYQCKCKNGFIRADWGDCIDVDECADGSLCPSGYNCKNTVGMTQIHSRKSLD